jgi:hypothetical protein
VRGCGGRGSGNRSPACTTLRLPKAALREVTRRPSAVELGLFFSLEFAGWSRKKVPSPFSSLLVNSLSKLTKTVSRGTGATSRTRISIPPRLWLDSLDGATCCSVTAKLWREAEEGEKRTVEGASAEDSIIGTIDHGLSMGFALGAHGAIAMWWMSSVAPW